WLRRKATEMESIGLWKRAVGWLDQLIAKEPHKAKELLYRRGFALAKSGQWQQAIDDFSILIELKEADWQILLYRALANAELRHTDAALSDCSRTTELAPHITATWLLRSLVYARAGRMQEAESDYATAAKLWRLAGLNNGLIPLGNKSSAPAG